MARKIKIFLSILLLGFLSITVSVITLWPRKPLTEREEVKEIKYPSIYRTRSEWISEREVLSVYREVEPGKDEGFLKPLVVNVLSGAQKVPQSLANLLQDYPAIGRWSFSVRDGWCLFYIETGSDSNFIRLFTKIDASVWQTTPIDSVSYHVFWMPERVAWLEFKNTLEGSFWYLCDGKTGGERQLVTQKPRVLEPIGFTREGTFVVSTAAFAATTPITLEYWALEPVPRLVRTKSVTEIPGTVSFALTSPTGEHIMWGWYRKLREKSGSGKNREMRLTISSSQAANFSFLGKVPDFTFTIPQWTPSGNAFSFGGDRGKYYLLTINNLPKPERFSWKKGAPFGELG